AGRRCAAEPLRVGDVQADARGTLVAGPGCLADLRAAQAMMGEPMIVGSAHATGPPKFTTSRAVTSEMYEPHMKLTCSGRGPTMRPAIAAASVASAIAASHHSLDQSSAAKPSALAQTPLTAAT